MLILRKGQCRGALGLLALGLLLFASNVLATGDESVCIFKINESATTFQMKEEVFDPTEADLTYGQKTLSKRVVEVTRTSAMITYDILSSTQYVAQVPVVGYVAPVPVAVGAGANAGAEDASPNAMYYEQPALCTSPPQLRLKVLSAIRRDNVGDRNNNYWTDSASRWNTKTITVGEEANNVDTERPVYLTSVNGVAKLVIDPTKGPTQDEDDPDIAYDFKYILFISKNFNEHDSAEDRLLLNSGTHISFTVSFYKEDTRVHSKQWTPGMNYFYKQYWYVGDYSDDAVQVPNDSLGEITFCDIFEISDCNDQLRVDKADYIGGIYTSVHATEPAKQQKLELQSIRYANRLTFPGAFYEFKNLEGLWRFQIKDRDTDTYNIYILEVRSLCAGTHNAQNNIIQSELNFQLTDITENQFYTESLVASYLHEYPNYCDTTSYPFEFDFGVFAVQPDTGGDVFNEATEDQLDALTKAITISAANQLKIDRLQMLAFKTKVMFEIKQRVANTDTSQYYRMIEVTINNDSSCMLDMAQTRTYMDTWKTSTFPDSSNYKIGDTGGNINVDILLAAPYLARMDEDQCKANNNRIPMSGYIGKIKLKESPSVQAGNEWVSLDSTSRQSITWPLWVVTDEHEQTTLSFMTYPDTAVGSYTFELRLYSFPKSVITALQSAGNASEVEGGGTRRMLTSNEGHRILDGVQEDAADTFYDLELTFTVAADPNGNAIDTNCKLNMYFTRDQMEKWKATTAFTEKSSYKIGDPEGSINVSSLLAAPNMVRENENQCKANNNRIPMQGYIGKIKLKESPSVQAGDEWVSLDDGSRQSIAWPLWVETDEDGQTFLSFKTFPETALGSYTFELRLYAFPKPSQNAGDASEAAGGGTRRMLTSHEGLRILDGVEQDAEGTYYDLELTFTVAAADEEAPDTNCKLNMHQTTTEMEAWKASEAFTEKSSYKIGDPEGSINVSALLAAPNMVRENENQCKANNNGIHMSGYIGKIKMNGSPSVQAGNEWVSLDSTSRQSIAWPLWVETDEDGQTFLSFKTYPETALGSYTFELRLYAFPKSVITALQSAGNASEAAGGGKRRMLTSHEDHRILDGVEEDAEGTYYDLELTFTVAAADEEAPDTNCKLNMHQTTTEMEAWKASEAFTEKSSYKIGDPEGSINVSALLTFDYMIREDEDQCKANNNGIPMQGYIGKIKLKESPSVQGGLFRRLQAGDEWVSLDDGSRQSIAWPLWVMTDEYGQTFLSFKTFPDTALGSYTFELRLYAFPKPSQNAGDASEAAGGGKRRMLTSHEGNRMLDGDVEDAEDTFFDLELEFTVAAADEEDNDEDEVADPIDIDDIVDVEEEAEVEDILEMIQSEFDEELTLSYKFTKSETLEIELPEATASIGTKGAYYEDIELRIKSVEPEKLESVVELDTAKALLTVGPIPEVFDSLLDKDPQIIVVLELSLGKVTIDFPIAIEPVPALEFKPIFFDEEFFDDEFFDDEKPPLPLEDDKIPLNETDTKGPLDGGKDDGPGKDEIGDEKGPLEGDGEKGPPKDGGPDGKDGPGKDGPGGKDVPFEDKSAKAAQIKEIFEDKDFDIEKVEIDEAEIIDSIEELAEVEIKLETLAKDIGSIFTSTLANASDSRKQEVLDSLMKARQVSLKNKVSDKGFNGAKKKKEIPKKPDFAFEPAQPDGRFSLMFDKGVAGLDLIRQLKVEVKAVGTVSDQFYEGDTSSAGTDDETDRRLLRALQDTAESEQDGFDLGRYIGFELRRGDEDSAPPEKLGFKAKVNDLDADKLYFALEFEHPLSVSTGTKKDAVVGIVRDSSFFSSTDSYLSVKVGTEIVTILPKMLPGANVVEILETSKEAMENTAQTLMTGQLIMTLVLSVSLKSMWNLLNVMQVLAYVRNFTVWPAMIEMVVKNIIEAIYLNQINNAIMDYGKTSFDVAKSSTKDEYLRQQGIESNDTMRNLGIFAISVGIILLVVAIYFCIRSCSRKSGLCVKIRNALSKKIFYNGPIRYVIVGYLKLFNQFITLVFLAYANSMGTHMVIGYGLVVFFLMMWPIWTEYFLIKNNKKLHDPVFKQKFESMYQGINTKSFGALCYNGVFAVRRFDLILLNVYFTENSPISGITRTMYLQKIIGFMIVQSFYIAYIHAIKPHQEGIFNKVEFVNEYCLIALGYCMLNYINMVPLDDDEQFNSIVEFIAIGIIGLMVCVNFGVMIRMSVGKIMLSLKRKKALKLAKEEAERRKNNMKRQREGVDDTEKKPIAASQSIKMNEPIKMNRFNRVKLSKQEAKEKRKDTILRPDQTEIFQVVNTSNVTNNYINVQFTAYQKPAEPVSKRQSPRRSQRASRRRSSRVYEPDDVESDAIQLKPMGITYEEKSYLQNQAVQLRQELKESKRRSRK